MGERQNMQGLEGQVIAGHYRLDRYLDEGGFGAVYRATQLAYGVELRNVAVKLGKFTMTDAEARRIFGDALMMARVAGSTPDATMRQHFVTIHDAGRCPDGGPLAGHPYVVMELVPGGSLQSCLGVGAFPLRRAVDYFDQILKAVAFMHTGVRDDDGRPHPIVHRDIKPGNILVTRLAGSDDVVKVTDFGLALEVGTLLGWAQSGGDLTYLAPESFSKDLCSPQSDVYMLALVFYVMLAGRNPFGAVGSHLRGSEEAKQKKLRQLHYNARKQESFDLLKSHVELKQRPTMVQVIRTALALDTSDRIYKNAGQFRNAWEQAKRGGRSPSAPASEQPWEYVARLTREARDHFATEDEDNGQSCLDEALAINRSRDRVPDRMVVGECYLLAVERLIKRGNAVEAGKIANEGMQRRECAATLRAMAQYFHAVDSPMASTFDQKADACRDREWPE